MTLTFGLTSMNPDGQNTHKVWTNAGWSLTFALKRWLLLLPFQFLFVWLCLRSGHPVALVGVGLTCWPVPVRFTVKDGEIVISWLVVRERVPLSSVREASVVEDPRACVLTRRREVLVLKRRHARPVLCFAPRSTLLLLHGAIQRALTHHPAVR